MHQPVIMSEHVHICEMFSSIQGEGYLAGRRQIFLRFPLCNLTCRYCDTDHKKADSCRVETKPGSAAFRQLPQPLTLQKVLDILSEWITALPGAHHSISITGGEPLLSVDTLKMWLPELRKSLPVHLETNGTMRVSLEQVIQHIDYISMDFKLPSTSGCTEHLWDVHRFFLQTAFTRNVSVKVVIGSETTVDEIDQVCKIMALVDRTIPLFLQPLTLPNRHIGISAAHIMFLQEVASSRLPDVRVIPQMHILLGAL